MSGMRIGGRWRKGVRSVAVVWVVLSLAGGGLAPALAQPVDMPRDHWAREAVMELIAAGYLTPFDDGTFRGEEPVDRYTFAAAIHRILREVETGVGRVAQEDVELLRQLSTEFRDELVEFYRTRDALMASVDDAEKRVAVFDETLNRVIATLGVLEADTETLREAIARETEALRRLLTGETAALSLALEDERQARQQEMDALRTQLDEEQALTLAALRAELMDIIDALRAENAALRAETAALRAALEQQIGTLRAADEEQASTYAGLRTELMDLIAGLRSEAAALDQRLGQLEADVAETWDETLWLSERVEDVYGRVDDLDERLSAVAAQAAGTEAQLGVLRADVTRLRAGLDDVRDQVAENQTAVDERLEATAQRLAEESAALRDEMIQLSQRLAGMQDRLAEAEAAVALLDQRVEEGDRETRAALQTLAEETELLMNASEALFDEVDSLYGRVQELQGALDNRDRQLGQLEASLRATREQVDDLAGRMGLSDEELARLAQRVQEELLAQLNLALMREQRMQQELEDLRQEFEGYRAAKDEEARSLRSSTSLAIGAAVVGILVGLLSK